MVQALSQGVDRRLPEFVGMLVERLEPAGILARNDPRVRLLEGLEQKVEVLYGTVPDVDRGARRARSTTTSIPTRDRRPGCSSISARTAMPPPRYARGRLLDAFSYNGGFALALSPVCDEVLAVDISEDAVARIPPTPRATAGQRRRARR